MGHSSGLVAAGTAWDGTACVNVDAPKFTASPLAGLHQPLLCMEVFRIGDYLLANSSREREKAAENLQLLRMHLDAFLGLTLKNARAALLKRKPDRSSATLVIYERKS